MPQWSAWSQVRGTKSQCWICAVIDERAAMNIGPVQMFMRWVERRKQRAGDDCKHFLLRCRCCSHKLDRAAGRMQSVVAARATSSARWRKLRMYLLRLIRRLREADPAMWHQIHHSGQIKEWPKRRRASYTLASAGRAETEEVYAKYFVSFLAPCRSQRWS